MKLSKAIIETVKEWASLFKSGICYVTKKENLTFTLKILWLFLPVPFCCWLFLVVGLLNWMFLFGFGILAFFLWVLFWLSVYDNMGVTYSSHYDEEQKKWVIDYKEEEKELPKP